MDHKQEVIGVIKEVIKYKGADFAILVAVEEMSELIKELLKNINRDKDNEDDIFEEISDVSTLMEYLKIIYDIPDEKIWEYEDKKGKEKWIPRIEKWKSQQG